MTTRHRSSPLTPPAEGRRYALRAGTVFDGRRFRTEVDVLVEDGRIEGLLPPTAYPAATEVLDYGADATLLPGMVDAHQHLVWDCSEDPVPWLTNASDDQLLDTARTNARTALAGGITTVRDLGDRNFVTLDLRAQIEADPTSGPRLLVSGPPLTSPGGHCWFLGGEVSGRSAMQAAVTSRAERGTDVVKVMATGGNVTPGSQPEESQFDADELRALVETAHHHDLPVAAHGHGVDGIAAAVAAGVDTIEHCSFLTADGVAERADIFDAMIESGIYASLTLGMLPGGAPPPPTIVQRWPLLMAHLDRLIAAGVPFTVGTDAGVGSAKPHDVLPYAVASLQQAGLDPDAALRAVTSDAAAAVGLDGRVGELAKGCTADLLVVGGDLRSDIAALHRVTAVYREGLLVSA